MPISIIGHSGKIRQFNPGIEFGSKSSKSSVIAQGGKSSQVNPGIAISCKRKFEKSVGLFALFVYCLLFRDRSTQYSCTLFHSFVILRPFYWISITFKVYGYGVREKWIQASNIIPYQMLKGNCYPIFHLKSSRNIETGMIFRGLHMNLSDVIGVPSEKAANSNRGCVT